MAGTAKPGIRDCIGLHDTGPHGWLERGVHRAFGCVARAVHWTYRCAVTGAKRDLPRRTSGKMVLMVRGGAARRVTPAAGFRGPARTGSRSCPWAGPASQASGPASAGGPSHRSTSAVHGRTTPAWPTHSAAGR